MNKLDTVVVDDEPLALEFLCSCLGSHPRVNIVARCRNGREAIAAVENCSPKILFLDIQMPGVSGIDVARRLAPETAPLIVFTTAYKEYALDAFDIQAVDYVLKPIDKESVHKAVQRVIGRLENNSPYAASISQGGYSSRTGVREAETPKVVIKDRGMITVLKQKDIQWIDAAGDYVCLHSGGQTHIKRSTMNELMSELDSRIFKRVHRSTIVNIELIENVKPCGRGEYLIKLDGSEQIKVSRNYKDVIKSLLRRHHSA